MSPSPDPPVQPGQAWAGLPNPLGSWVHPLGHRAEYKGLVAEPQAGSSLLEAFWELAGAQLLQVTGEGPCPTSLSIQIKVLLLYSLQKTNLNEVPHGQSICPSLALNLSPRGLCTLGKKRKKNLENDLYV